MLERGNFGAQPLIRDAMIITAIVQPTDCCGKRPGAIGEHFYPLFKLQIIYAF
jgi:hypothetical protein